MKSIRIHEGIQIVQIYIIAKFKFKQNTWNQSDYFEAAYAL